MTSRRSFFKRLASIVAVVAIAPEIAFARKLETAPGAISPDTIPFWFQTTRVSRYVDSEYRKVFEQFLMDNENFREFGDC